MEQSKINPLIDMEYIKTKPENKYFDVKSSKIKASDLAPHFSAFANAEGGVIVVGVSDKKREIEGMNSLSSEKYNNIISAPKDCCSPMPNYKIEVLAVKNKDGKEDEIILFHIEAETERIIRTTNGTTYLRIGDKSKELKGEDLINLEYDRNTRRYEDELNKEAVLEDLDLELLNEYKEKISALELSNEQVLKARGFLKEKDNKQFLTNGAVLLFAKNITEFYPNCRIRFLKYDGNAMQVGERINIIKDINIECSLLKIIEKAREVVSFQLRDFITLNKETGKFMIVPEYPEFAWLEGIVNAVTHREYAFQGNYIMISMYNDRLEITSPGKLPNIVTLENIKETRYSRNPRIARVLTEFGWVRELNEGVKRIYEDMKMFFLDEPQYSEPNNSVKLVLKNNIIMRKLRQSDKLENSIGEEVWAKLDIIERKIILYIANRGKANRKELEKETGKSATTVNKRIKKLIDENLIVRVGDKSDPKHYLELKNK
ncbi:putative DNA binding domain-containing protein [Fusobacterium sp. SB021]|uniref:ATP-binding protein n=1 Tax=Fusobacterium sp. SB021 TaxID=2744227 RepID=UPI003CF31A5F